MGGGVGSVNMLAGLQCAQCSSLKFEMQGTADTAVRDHN